MSNPYILVSDTKNKIIRGDDGSVLVIRKSDNQMLCIDFALASKIFALGPSALSLATKESSPPPPSTTGYPQIHQKQNQATHTSLLSATESCSTPFTPLSPCTRGESPTISATATIPSPSTQATPLASSSRLCAEELSSRERNPWTSEQIKCLIAAYGDHLAYMRSTTMAKEKVWGMISKRLKSHTTVQCQNKFKYLKQRYMEKKTTCRRTGPARRVSVSNISRKWTRFLKTMPM